MKIKQIIKSKYCLNCDVCCRFLDKKTPLAPVFLPNEISSIVKPCLDNKSGRVRLKLSHTLNMYICPFFNERNNACTIYSNRPLDCRLYPLMVTYDKKRKNIILSIDTKCPFVTDIKNKELIKKWADYTTRYLEKNHIAHIISKHKYFIGPYYEDAIPFSTLSALTKLILMDPAKDGFKKLELKDRFIFERLMKRRIDSSGNTFVNLYIWKKVNPVWWKKSNRGLIVLLETSSGYINLANLKRFSDYIYLRRDIAELKGKRYRHKRAMYNYFVKHYNYQYIPYQKTMKNECMRLFNLWAKGRKQKYHDAYYHRLIDETRSSHKIVLEEFDQLGIIGRVVKIDKKIRGYTFGFELTSDCFCILLEITDLNFKGISEFIFREFCREMSRYKYINTMDDSGLENLKVTKLSYHPLPQHIWSKSQ